MNTLIKKRYSPRAFAEKMVDSQTLEVLFKAAGWAPSARNEQPWSFVYATKDNQEQYHTMFSILNEWNQKWAQSAPVLIAAVARLNYDHKNLPNEHAVYDLGQAVSYFTFQATELDLFVHQMGGFSKSLAKKYLQIPEGYDTIAMIALGYKGELNRIPEEYHESENAERSRKPLKSFAFKGVWQK